MKARGPKIGNLRRRIRVSQIELLAALQQKRTLSEAAQKVNLSQPAASRMLSELARDLDIELFERIGRTLHPTEAGRALIRRAAEFIGELERTQSELEAIDNGLVGTVTLGTGIGPSYTLVPKALTLLRKDGRAISVTVHEGALEELFQKLSERRIDLIVSRLNLGAFDRSVVCEELYNPPLTVVCGPRHRLCRVRKLSWSMVLDEEWILSESGTPMRSGLEAIFQREGRRPSRCLTESSSIPTNVELLNQHQLLWVLSADISDYFARLGLLRILDLPSISGPAPVTMAYLKERPPSAAILRLMDCLRTAGRNIVRSSLIPPRRWSTT